MTLAEIRPGQKFCIRSIKHDETRLQALRLGLVSGCTIACEHRLWGGPIVISLGQQEIVLGHRLAQHIEGEVAEHGLS